jgi:hypothetical protein
MKIYCKITLFSLLLIGVVLIFPKNIFAQEAQTADKDLGASLPKISSPLANPKLSVGIPGFSGFQNISCDNPQTEDAESASCVVPWLAEFINGLFRYGIGLIILLAVVVMMVGGVIWLTAGGKEEKISDAKNLIGGSVLGIVIALSSYIILNIVNPALTVLSPIKLAYVQKEDLEDLDLSKSAEELGISQSQLNNLRGENPYQEGCGNIEKCKQFGSTMPSGLVKVDPKYGNVYVKAEVYEAFKKALNCVNPNKVTFTITDGWRNAAAQIQVKKEKPGLAATPCCSNHGSGSAMDLARGVKDHMSWEYNESSGLTKCMNQNGLYANLRKPPGKKDEPWHWSPTGN